MEDRGFESRQEQRENVLFQGQLSVLLFWYPFHPRVTTVAHKKEIKICHSQSCFRNFQQTGREIERKRSACLLLNSFLSIMPVVPFRFCYPSKHARSDSHPGRIGWEALATGGPDDCCTPACFRTGSAWPKPGSQPELNRIRDVFV